MEKLQIYYQPSKKDDSIKSLTISYYDFEENTNTFKKKVVLEKDGEKYKIKRMYGWFSLIKPFLENLDLSEYISRDINKNEAYFYIKYGNQSFTTNNADDIRELLDWSNFDKIIALELNDYIENSTSILI